MKRVLFFVYGVAAHALFFGVYGYMALFVNGLGAGWLPKTIDGPVSNLSLAGALSVNVALMLVFGLQHSIMARPAFKNWWTKFVPAVIERSTYVMISNLIMIALFAFWQPIDGILWNVQTPALRTVLWATCALGWILVPVASLMINHFDLFGTRQVWLHLRGEEYQHLPFRTPRLYKHVRHPLYVGWLMTFWITPTMSSGHLLFAAVMTAYILIAIRFEERDLVKHFGRKYAEYRNEVPALVPRITAKPNGEVDAATQQ
jgi:protein-S-isoprenylcysteine O-methyltransferase Ste14